MREPYTFALPCGDLITIREEEWVTGRQFPCPTPNCCWVISIRVVSYPPRDYEHPDG